MLTIWGRNNSTNVKKVIWCLAELNVPFKHINVGGKYGQLDQPAYRSLNPNGLIPCLQDDNFVLWESNTIVRYLAAQYSQGVLYPQNIQVRASAEKWMDWTSSSLMPHFKDVFIGLIRTPLEQQDKNKIQQSAEQLDKFMGIANGALEKQTYFSGDTFGVGDIPPGCISYAWFNLPIKRTKYPNLERWYQQMVQRPAFQKTIMIELT